MTSVHRHKTFRAARTAAALAVLMLGPMLAVSTPAAASATVPTAEMADCLLYESSDQLACYRDFRTAMKVATAGAVTDAPRDGSRLDAATTERIAAAGETATRAMAAGTAAAAPVVLGVAYKNADFTGGTLNLISTTGTCSGGNRYFFNSFSKGVFNDAISSFKNLTDCASNYYLDANPTGTHHMWYSNDQLAQVPADDQYSSVEFWDGPSRQELFDRCDSRAEYCRFEPTAAVTESAAGFREVARHWNCTPYDNNLSVEWSDTTGGSISMATEVSATASFGIGALGNVSASISQSIGREWNWESTVSRTTSLDAGPMGWAALDRSPKLQTVQGTIEMKLKNSAWGRKEWHIWDFKATVEVPGHLGVTRSRGGPMTEAEIAALCTDPARRAAAPTRFETRHELADA
ncbi:hypothetical protein O7632_01840 [Solwaraspora sp. WMMD406]|uniref:hypothetical protein n=1 Tax=Solwaraspora sp. WMMD406 TaxID=3016095 RepID=UPI0024172DD8|nr:hypothetical protein [Solwaraspora sp. WMMD406]MDG4762863.1 hypothetical protein [Solwaraspora sp. WMMD406]